MTPKCVSAEIATDIMMSYNSGIISSGSADIISPVHAEIIGSDQCPAARRT
jgi:hypothetical protein